MKTFLGMLLGGAILAATGCTKEAPLYPGGPVGPAAALNLSSALFVVNAGGAPATVAARVEDSVGNPTSDAVSFASCDPAKVTVAAGAAMDQWTSSADISGVTLGASCVTATGAGMTDTIRVRIAPGTIVIAGPDSVLSGAGASFGVEFYSLDGTQLTAGADFPIPDVQSLNALRLPIQATDPLTYDAAGQQPGAVVLQISTNTDFGSVTANKIVTVVPGVFTGALSATSGAIQTMIKVTPGAGIAFDADTRVRFGPVASSYYGENWDGTAADAPIAVFPDSLLFIVPASIPLGTYDAYVLDQGPNQIASKTSFTVVAGGTPVGNRQPYPGANTPGARLENKPLPVIFPVVFPDAGTTSYYTVSPTAAFQYTMVLHFPCPGDLDIQIIDGGFTAYQGDQSGETYACPEATVWRTAANGFNFIRIYNYNGAATPGDMTVLPGCVELQNGDGVSTKQSSTSRNWRASGCPYP
jgi:hypothetical protein